MPPKKRGVLRMPKFLYLTKGQIRTILARQAAEAAAARLETQTRERLINAVKSFKPLKSDYGKMVMISTLGKPHPEAKDRKGYLVMVSKTGKKRFVPQEHKTSSPLGPIKPYKISSLSPPLKKYRKAGKEFQRRRLLLVKEGRKKLRAVRRGEGEVHGEKDLINTLSDVVTAALRRQVSHRTYLITIMVRIETPDGKPETHTVEVEVSRRDHVAIERAGVKNFVKKKVWAFLATELSLAGYVTQQSYNHIRRAARNRNKPRSQWTDSRGEKWPGADLENVKITHVEFRIEQMRK
jgi:hypothetical protein